MILEFAILGFLAESPASGYELKTRCFGGAASTFWSADQAQIYRTCDRLEREGLIASSLTHQTKRPNKKTFEITDAGRDALNAWLHSDAQPAPIRDPFALRLFFSGSLPPQELSSLITTEISAQEAQLSAVETELSKLEKTPGKISAKKRSELRVKKTALEGVKMRILAEIEARNNVLSTLAEV